MAYTTVDNPELYFQIKLYTGNGSTQAITFDGSENMRPDFIWCKARNQTRHHYLTNAILGVKSRLRSDANNEEYTANSTSGFDSFDSNGFTLEADSSSLGLNESGHSMVSWNWSAGGSAPAITYTVKVVSDSGNKYRFDDFGTSAVTLDLQEGGTYTFDQSDSSNSGHPLRFSTTSDGSHGGGSEYTTNVTTTGTPGNSGAKTVITLGSGVATLYYYCTQHSGMGGQANTNSLFGSSNFGGSIQSTVSAGSTQGFSIVKYTGTESNATIGHGLGSAISWYIVKELDNAQSWYVYHQKATYSGSNAKDTELYLDTNDRAYANAKWNDTAPTSNNFSISNSTAVNQSSTDYIAFCFKEVAGYSKHGSFVGNGSSSGSYIHLGFKPSMVIFKNISTSNRQWQLLDAKRSSSSGNNVINATLSPNNNNDESWWGTNNYADFLSNGFKLRANYDGVNESGGTYIYMAFAESPFVNSNGVPTNAR